MGVWLQIIFLSWFIPLNLVKWTRNSHYNNVSILASLRYFETPSPYANPDVLSTTFVSQELDPTLPEDSTTLEP